MRVVGAEERLGELVALRAPVPEFVYGMLAWTSKWGGGGQVEQRVGEGSEGRYEPCGLDVLRGRKVETVHTRGFGLLTFIMCPEAAAIKDNRHIVFEIHGSIATPQVPVH